jgi:HD-like signal output (HDOD) protein
MTNFYQITAESARQRQTMAMLRDYAHRLPVLPGVATAILDFDRDDPGLPDLIEELALIDPALTIRMLCLGSHLFTNNPGEHLTLPFILSKLGAVTVAGSLIQLATAPSFKPVSTVERELWLHSLQVALAAKYLAQRHPECGLMGDEAYLMGLIHDVGRFIMLATSRDRFNETGSAAWDRGEQLVRLEVEICGFDHATLGALASHEWQFPDIASQVIHYHHAPRRLAKRSSAKRLIAAVEIVNAADTLSFLLLKHPEFSGADTREQAVILRDFHLSPYGGVTQITEAEILRIVEPVVSKSHALWERATGHRALPAAS